MNAHERLAHRVGDATQALLVRAHARGDGVGLRAPLPRDVVRGLRRIPPALDHAAVGAEPSARWVAHPPAPRAPADEAHAQRGVLVVHVLTNVLRLGAASRAHVEPRVGLLERLGAARDARDAPEVRHPSFPSAPAPPTVFG